MARVALAYVLAKPFVTSIIIGAKTVEQLDDNLAATALELTPEEVKTPGRGQRPALRIPRLDVSSVRGPNRIPKPFAPGAR